ncbi:MAG: carbohydrate binding domain-containing protein [archaeon]
MKRQMRRSEIAFLAAVLALFFFLNIRDIGMPALSYDAVIEPIVAMQMLSGGLSDEVKERMVEYSVNVSGVELPVMATPYAGWTLAYLYMGIFGVFDISVYSIRIPLIMLQMLMLVAYYLFTKGFFSRKVAYVATAALAFHINFLYMNRSTLIIHFLMLLYYAALLCFLRYADTKKRRYLYAGFFMLGFGTYTLLLFLFYLFALAASAPVLLRWKNVRPVLPLKRKEAALAACSFAAGCMPLLIYNIITLGTFKFFFSNFPGTRFGTNNLDVSGNLATNITQLLSVSPVIYNLLLLASVIIILAGIRSIRRNLAFVLVNFAVILLTLTVTVTNFGAHHKLILLPLMAQIIAVSVVRVFGHNKIYLWLWVIFLVIAGSIYTLRYETHIIHPGDAARYSDALYRLSEYLMENGIAEPLIMDWGISNPVLINTRGAVAPIDIYVSENPAEEGPPAEYIADIKDRVNDPANAYVFYSKRHTIFRGRLEGLEQAAREAGKELAILEKIRDSKGEEIFFIYKVIDSEGEAGDADQTIDDFEDGDLSNMVFEGFGSGDPDHEPSVFIAASADSHAFEGRNSLRLSVSFGEDQGVVKHIKAYRNIGQDWSDYESISFAVRGDGMGGMLHLYIVDRDDDWWEYRNADVLLGRNWTLITVLFDELEPQDESFPFQGNGRRDLDMVKSYRFRIDNDLNAQEERVIYIDSVSLGGRAGDNLTCRECVQ